jgi:tyrosine-protein kinase Etk/Wzc
MNEQPIFQEKPETNIFIQVLQKYLPFWPLFALTIPIAMSVSYVYLRSQIPIYVASAKVLLKDPNKGSGDSKVLDALNIFSEKKIVDNEILVLKSSSIVQQVVKELDLYATVYNQGKVRLEELYGQNSPLSFIALDEDSILSYNKFFFSIDWQKRTVSIHNQTIPFDSTILLGNTNYRVVINDHYNKAVTGKNYFVLLRPVAIVAGGISGAIKAAPLSNVSTVLDVSLSTPEPLKGEAILTKLFAIYNREGIEDKNQIALRTLAFIDGRLRLLNGQLDSVEKNIVSFKSRESLYSVGSQAELFLGKVQALDQQRGEIDLQLEILNDIKTYVQRKGINNGTVPSLGLVTDATLSGLLTQLYQAEFDRDNAIKITGEQSEPVIIAKEKVARLKDDIQENLGNIRANLLTVKNDIVAKTNLNNGLLTQVPQKERGLLEISREQGVKNSIYSYLLQKREETALSSASTSSDLRVILTVPLVR